MKARATITDTVRDAKRYLAECQRAFMSKFSLPQLAFSNAPAVTINNRRHNNTNFVGNYQLASIGRV